MSMREKNCLPHVIRGLCDAKGSNFEKDGAGKTPANLTRSQSEPDRLRISVTDAKFVQSQICKPVQKPRNSRHLML